MDSEYDDGQTSTTFEYGVTGEDFNPEVGLSRERRTDTAVCTRGLQETLRQETIRELGVPRVPAARRTTRATTTSTGGLQSAELHVDNHWDWENGNFISTAAQRHVGRAARSRSKSIRASSCPPGEHGGLRFTLRANTDRRKWLFGRLQWDMGRFLTGDQSSPTFQVILRDSGRFTLDTTWNYRAIDLPQGVVPRRISATCG